MFESRPKKPLLGKIATASGRHPALVDFSKMFRPRPEIRTALSQLPTGGCAARGGLVPRCGAEDARFDHGCGQAPNLSLPSRKH